MATSDNFDMLSRLRAVIPWNWFPNTSAPVNIDDKLIDYNGNLITDGNGNPIDVLTYNSVTPTNSPVLDGLLSGCAATWSWVYSLLSFTKLQTRIATASGIFLDIIAYDFFANFLGRRSLELDSVFRGRIQRELFREKGTRAGLVKAVTDLTGRAPFLFEPGYTNDTGGYNTGSMGYGVAGGYGSIALPFQCFIKVYRPVGGGISSIGGYGSSPGGYGVGSLEYVNPSMYNVPVTDQDILNTINDVKPAATIVWTYITNFPISGHSVWDGFVWDSGVTWS